MMIDLVYVIDQKGKWVSCIIDDDVIGPFTAKESGPKIVAELLDRKIICTRNAGENWFIFTHMNHIRNGHNHAGKEYPYRIEGEV
jgi:hypothetical protein